MQKFSGEPRQVVEFPIARLRYPGARVHGPWCKSSHPICGLLPRLVIATRRVLNEHNNGYMATRRRFTGPNVWPNDQDLPGCREHILQYLDAMEAFTNRLLPAVAVSLDLDPGFFLPHFVGGQFNLRLSHYPPVPAAANQFGIAPHTDANFMTFLAQSDVPGLQVRTPSGDWVDVPFVPGSAVVDMFRHHSRLSGGVAPGFQLGRLTGQGRWHDVWA